jgi:hypothetical protein
MLGTGGMARSFADMFCAVRPIKLIKVYSPNRAHVDAYVDEMERRLGCAVVAVASAEECTRESDIVAACTNSMSPVFKGEWLEPGAHVTNVMSWELGPDVCERIDAAGLVIRRTPPVAAGFVDDDFAVRMNVLSYAAGQPDERAKIPQSSWEAQGIQDRSKRYPNARYVDCVDWQTGERYRRDPKEITTLATQSFGVLEGEIGPSAGIQGIQFSTIGGRMYENALRQGLGTELPREMFLQDIPT